MLRIKTFTLEHIFFTVVYMSVDTREVILCQDLFVLARARCKASSADSLLHRSSARLRSTSSSLKKSWNSQGPEHFLTQS